jgi:hypothetical protein
VTEEMVRERASEIAVVNGRGKNNIMDSDLALARRELLGEERLNPSPTAAESIPEGARWQLAGGDTGGKVENVPAPDEQTFAEKLVEEGAADAEHDLQVEATRESLKRDQREK